MNKIAYPKRLLSVKLLCYNVLGNRGVALERLAQALMVVSASRKEGVKGVLPISRNVVLSFKKKKRNESSTA
jgi:hypothetical protein